MSTGTQLVVGLGDGRVSNDCGTELTTYALGSCIGLTLYDPVANVGGMLHFMLPEASLSSAKAQQNPFMFADTGIPAIFHWAYRLGAEKRRMVIRAAGGAQVMDPDGVFNIGKRNHLAMRKILWKAGVMLDAEEVGGTSSRTIRLEVSTGRLWMRGAGSGEQEITRSAFGKGIKNVSPADR